MENWQWGLVLLVGAWALQAVGTWRQMRHYRLVMGDITRRWPDGWLGVGNARGTFRKGVIGVVVVTPDETVRRVLFMEGRSVFAKFIEVGELAGLPLAELASAPAVLSSPSRKIALDMAVGQIRKAQSKVETAEVETAKVESAEAGASRIEAPGASATGGGDRLAFSQA